MGWTAEKVALDPINPDDEAGEFSSAKPLDTNDLFGVVVRI